MTAPRTALSAGELGHVLRDLRRHLGLTQEDAAQRIGCTVGTWNRWERGRFRPSKLARRAIEQLAAEADVAPGAG